MKDDPDRGEIEALVAALDAAASTQDIDRFLALFIPGPDFAFTYNGRMETAPAAVRAAHLETWSRAIKVEFHTAVSRIVRLAPDAAVLSAVGRSQRLLLTGQPQAGEYAIMLALRRTPEGWRVVQCHESTPAT